MDLAEGLGSAITGLPVAWIPSTDWSTPDILVALVREAGGAARAAGILGVSPSTLYRWRTGRQSPKMQKDAMVAAWRAHRMAVRMPELLKTVGPHGLKLAIQGVVTRSRDVRPRTLHVGRYISRRTMMRIIRSWLTAQDEKCSRQLADAIDREYMETDDDTDIDPTRMWWE